MMNWTDARQSSSCAHVVRSYPKTPLSSTAGYARVNTRHVSIAWQPGIESDRHEPCALRLQTERPATHLVSERARHSRVFGGLHPAALMPEKAQMILARAHEYAYSRVFCGSHLPG